MPGATFVAMPFVTSSVFKKGVKKNDLAKSKLKTTAFKNAVKVAWWEEKETNTSQSIQGGRKGGSTESAPNWTDKVRVAPCANRRKTCPVNATTFTCLGGEVQSHQSAGRTFEERHLRLTVCFGHEPTPMSEFS